MIGKVAIVGATARTAALEKLVGGDFSLELTVGRTTADHVRQAVGADGAAIIDLPAGEARDFVRELGARNVRVVDLGPDLRVPQVSCGFDESRAHGKRMVALPSAGTMAALAAAGPLLHKGLLFGDRIAVYLVEAGTPGPLALEGASADLAADLGWALEQRGLAPLRRIGVRIRAGEGLLALVQGELGNEEAQDENALRAALEGGREWVHVCGKGSHPDAARVAGTGNAEISVSVDGFAEWIVCSGAVDPVWFPAHAALRALRQMD